MARPRPLERYPRHYALLMIRASEQPVHIELENARRADSLRNELYTFRRVLFHEGNRRESPELWSIALLADAVRLRVDRATGTLIAEPFTPGEPVDSHIEEALHEK